MTKIKQNRYLKRRLERKVEQLQPSSGHRYSRACKQMMMLILISVFVRHLEADISVDPTHENACYEEAAEICHCSVSLMRREWNLFEQQGHIKSPKKRGRKRRQPDICYEGENLRSEHILHLQQDIQKYNNETGGVTLQKRSRGLKKEFNISVRYALLRKVLLRLGFKWIRGWVQYWIQYSKKKVERSSIQ